MPTNDELYSALRNAHAAGDAEAARKIAAYIQSSEKTAPAPVEYRTPTPGDIPANTGIYARGGSSAPSAPAPEDNFLGKLWGNVVEPVATVGTGMLGAVVGSIAGAGSAIASGKYGTQEGIREGEKTLKKVAEALTYRPQTETGKSNVAAIGKAMVDSGVAGLPLGAEMNAMARLARPSVAQAARAVETDVYAAKKLAAKVADAKILPKVDAEKAKLAQKAIDMGIDITPDMLTNNKYARIARETLEKIPFSGSKADGRQVAFNRAVIKAIGGDKLKPRLTPDVFEAAMEKAGSKIGDIAAKTNIPLDDALSGSLAAYVDDVSKYGTTENARIVGNYAADLAAKAADNGGIVPGEAFRQVHSKIGRQARGATDGDLKATLGGFQELMDDALEMNLKSPEQFAALAEARKQYAIGKTIEPLVAKAPEGNISHSALMGRVTASGDGKHRMATGQGGELGDLARIGQQFLKEPASSGTAERGAILTGAGAGATGVASIFSPGVAAGAAGLLVAANAYNRLGPRVAQRMIKNSMEPTAAPVRFADELALADESAFAPRQAAPVVDAPYNGLLSAEQSPFPTRTPSDTLMPNRADFPSVEYPILEGGGPLPIQKAGERPALPQGPTVAAPDGIDYFGNQAPTPAATVADNGLLSLLEREGAQSPAKPIDYNAIEFLPTIDEMDARGPFQGPPQAPGQSKLAWRVAKQKAEKLRRISGAQSIDDAIRGASGE